MNRPVAAALALVLLAAACGEPFGPRRPAPYSYADTLGSPIVFHWPPDRLPVRYYAAPEGNLPALVTRGLDLWAAQFLYGEFRATLVPDSTRADVIVRFEAGPPPAAAPDTNQTAPACVGRTDPIITPGDTLELPIRTSLQWFGTYTPEQVAACLLRVATHEVGHTLGLFNAQHAGADSSDIMDATPRVYRPSGRDRATVGILYHVPATIAPGARP